MADKDQAPDRIYTAWKKAQDAWVAAGKQIPCYEPNYMKARAVLAKEYKRHG